MSKIETNNGTVVAVLFVVTLQNKFENYKRKLQYFVKLAWTCKLYACFIICYVYRIVYSQLYVLFVEHFKYMVKMCAELQTVVYIC